MQPTPGQRQELLERICAWAAGAEAVRALILTGSAARVTPPADEWSDFDLVLLTNQLDRYRGSADWMAEIADPWITTVERAPDGQIVERRALFRGGIDADFILLDANNSQALRAEPLRSITRRGARVLLDKDGLFPAGFPAVEGPQAPAQATPEAFEELVNDFWFHIIWTGKKIRRGELWTAKSCCDVYLKKLLLTLLEWHVQALEGAGQETWYNGRFIERWAPGWVLERLPKAFARYDEAEVWAALRETALLFDRLAQETALHLYFAYQPGLARPVLEWLGQLHPSTASTPPRSIKMDTGSIRLRQLARADAPALMAFYNGLSQASIRTFRPLGYSTTLEVCQRTLVENEGTAPTRYDLAAWDGEQVVGWGSLFDLDKAQPELGLGVSDAYHGQGIGTRLMASVVAEARLRGLKLIHLIVVQDNARAIKLYQNFGFEITGEHHAENDPLPYYQMVVKLSEV